MPAPGGRRGPVTAAIICAGVLAAVVAVVVAFVPGSPPRPVPLVPTSPPGPCPAGGCVTIDATRPVGPFGRAGAGVNQSVRPGDNLDARSLRALRIDLYRSAPVVSRTGAFDWTDWDVAARAGVRTELVLSDLWAGTDRGGPPRTPWSDWSEYAAWVKGTVSRILASGRRVDYWDVYNEPGWTGYYSPADFATETPGDLLQQFLVTYDAIRSVDPSAAIVGPSIGDWTLDPLPAGNGLTNEPDLATFLRFAADHRLRLAAVAWHDNGNDPPTISSELDRTEAVVRSLPALGDPPMFLDEYGSASTQPIPGWDVGYLAAVAAGGVRSAGRSCWNTCSAPALDGLLTDDGLHPTPEYFVSALYSEMGGQRAAVASTSERLPAVATVRAGRRRVVALIGRDQSCAVESWCVSGWPHPGDPLPGVPAGPEPVRVQVAVPWRGPVRIALAYEPFLPGSHLASPVTSIPVGMDTRPSGRGELVSFTISGFADGSAYDLVLSS